MTKHIEFEEGWAVVEEGIAKVMRISEGEIPKEALTTPDYLLLYTAIYNMCAQLPPYDCSQQLYTKYHDTIAMYLTSTVLPILREKQQQLQEEDFLKELVKRWENHRVFVKMLSRFFQYLDVFYTKKERLPSLKQVGFTCFRDVIFDCDQCQGKARAAALALIQQAQEGNREIDLPLLKNALGMFVETRWFDDC